MTTAARKKIAEFESERSSFRKRMKERLRKSSKKQRRDALVSAGVITAGGQLAAAYRSPVENGVITKVLKKADRKAPVRR